MRQPSGQVFTHRVGTIMRAPKTAELIAAHLRRQIVRGDLEAGATLPPEVELMEQFGVSRPTLREAFRILETESLIGVRRGARGGAQVLEPDPTVAARHVGLLLQLQGTTVRDVYDARMVTEPVCAGMLAARRTQQDIDDLREVLAQVKEIIEAGIENLTDASAWSTVTYRFRDLILRRCGNNTLAVQGAVLADIVDADTQRVFRSAMDGDPEAPARYRKILRSYGKLIELVEARDSEGAEMHWHKHMKVVAEYFLVEEGTNHSLVDLFS